jgi:hypothetical protein
MDRDDFIKLVVGNVTEFGTIPISPKNSSINSIIETAKRFFYEKWADAQEERYIVISHKVFNSPNFKNERVVKMPKTVRYIHQLEEAGSDFFYHDINPDFRKTNFNYAAYAVNGNSDMMVTAMTYAFYQDFLKQFVVKSVAYNYNSNTHNLFILGRDNIGSDLVGRAYIDICEEDLMESDLFLRYVIAQCRASIARAFTLIDMKVLGGGKIDFNDIKSQGDQEIKDIKQEMKDDDDGAAFFIVDGQFIG